MVYPAKISPSVADQPECGLMPLGGLPGPRMTGHNLVSNHSTIAF
jgi:hypothetical protein